jgi:hypothetical protein
VGAVAWGAEFFSAQFFFPSKEEVRRGGRGGGRAVGPERKENGGVGGAEEKKVDHVFVSTSFFLGVEIEILGSCPCVATGNKYIYSLFIRKLFMFSILGQMHLKQQNISHYYFLPLTEIYIYFRSSKIYGAYCEQYSSELHLSIVSVQ